MINSMQCCWLWQGYVAKAIYLRKTCFAWRMVSEGYLCVNRDSGGAHPWSPQHALGSLFRDNRWEGHVMPPGLGVRCGRELCNPLGKTIFSLKERKKEPFISENAYKWQLWMLHLITVTLLSFSAFKICKLY